MARALLKSLQCRSNATEDVIISTPRPSSSDNASIKKSGSTAVFCSNSSQSIRDAVILLSQQHPTVSKKHSKPPEQNSQLQPLLKSKSKSKSKSKIDSSTPPSPKPVGPSTPFPILMDLAPGHSSRKVVEIIFESSWSENGTGFTGQIEMMFRVHNTHRTVSRFEEYREVVRARADDVRCAVDGNEMMMFHSGRGDVNDGIYDASLECCKVKLPGGGGTIKGFRMFSTSGGAHERTGGGVVGRRSMMVCRVIVGRVKNVSDLRSGADSAAIATVVVCGCYCVCSWKRTSYTMIISSGTCSPLNSAF